MLLGSDDGWQTLWNLLDQDPETNAFRHDLARAMPFTGRNPLYYVFHESSYADGHSTYWAAEAGGPEGFHDELIQITGGHAHRDWADSYSAFVPSRMYCV